MEIVSGIPVVDFSAFSIGHKTRPSIDSKEVQELARNIHHAFSTVGFVYLRNHGITQNQVDQVLQVMDKFFGGNTEIKSKYKKNKGASMNGWDELERESTNIERPGDLKESFDIACLDDTEFLWPDEEVPNFKPTIQSMFQQLKVLALRVMTIIAIGLQLDPDVFDSSHQLMGTKEGGAQLRLNYYPKVTSDVQVKAGQIRCGEHTDYRSITLLFQDEAGGLEVANKEGQFIPAMPIRGTVLVNIADLLQRWTSDRLKSTLHRVVIPVEEIKRANNRRSIVFFCMPDPETIITCLDGSNKYPPVNAGQYVEGLLTSTYKY